jgi:hypothetical protein
MRHCLPLYTYRDLNAAYKSMYHSEDFKQEIQLELAKRRFIERWEIDSISSTEE